MSSADVGIGIEHASDLQVHDFHLKMSDVRCFTSLLPGIDASRHDSCVASLTWLILPVVIMLVSKIKPCMSQYKPLHGNTANGSLKQL